MKKELQLLFAVLFCCIFTADLSAQTDTLLQQDFQEDISSMISPFPDEDNPQMYTSWDEDGIPDANDRPPAWYWALEIAAPDSIPAADSNFVYQSSSWLQGYDPGSTNWFITPAIDVPNNDATTLHWKTSPFQGPRYMDGYALKILVGNPFYGEADQVDEIFTAAEMTGWIGDNQSLDPDTFEFSPGYIHADTYTDSLFFIAPTVDSAGILSTSLNLGVLEPHSISLADYAGQTIFIAFHHNSSDDNLIEVDDIVVLGDLLDNTNDELISEFRYVTYPNPVDNYLNVMWRLKETADTQVSLYNMNGKLIQQTQLQKGQFGEMEHRFNMINLPSGNYNIVLEVNGERVTKMVTKK